MTLRQREISVWGPRALGLYGAHFENGFLVPNRFDFFINFDRKRTKKTVNSNWPVARKIKWLRVHGLLASPSVPYRFRKESGRDDFAITAYRYESYLQSTPSTTFFKRVVEGYRCFAAAISGFEHLYDIESWKRGFFRSPVAMCSLLKKELTELRRFLFNPCRPYKGIFEPLLAVADMQQLLQTTMAQRGLPEGPVDDKLIKDCVQRLCSPSVVDPSELAHFEKWVSEWTDYHRPEVPPSTLSFRPSRKGCIGRTRNAGGVTSWITNTLAQSLERSGKSFFSGRLPLRGDCFAEDGSIQILKNNDHMIAVALQTLEPYFAHSRVCKGGCQDWDLHPPLKILAVPFKGWRTRSPQMTIPEIGIFARVLRSAADEYLRNDERIRPSLEGKAQIPRRKPEEGEFYRSLDLTTATDNHSVEFERVFYKRLNPGFSWWDDVVNVVCGFFTLELGPVDPSVPEWRVPPREFAYYARTLSLTPSELRERLRRQKLHQPALKRANWRVRLYDSYGPVTRKGAPMGISTSWPLMPLLTLYAFEKASSFYKRMTIHEREVSLKPLTALSQARVFTTGKVLQMTKVSRDVPENFQDIQVTGDDGSAVVTPEISRLMSVFLRRLGSFASATKDFSHPKLALYVEKLFWNGHEAKVFPWSVVLSPKDSSSEDREYYSSPLAIASMEARHGISIPLIRSPWYGIWIWLARNGASPYRPVSLGGLGNPNLPVGSGKVLVLERDFPVVQVPDPLTEGLLAAKTDHGTFIPGGKQGIKDEFAISKNRDTTNRQMIARVLPCPTVKINYFVWAACLRHQSVWNQLEAWEESEKTPSPFGYLRLWRRFGCYHPNETELAASVIADREFEVEIPRIALKQAQMALSLRLQALTGPKFILRDKKRTVTLV